MCVNAPCIFPKDRCRARDVEASTLLCFGRVPLLCIGRVHVFVILVVCIIDDACILVDVVVLLGRCIISVTNTCNSVDNACIYVCDWTNGGAGCKYSV